MYINIVPNVFKSTDHFLHLSPLQDGTELPLKEAGTGDSVHSMLSILNAIIGNTRTFKSVAAKATRDSYVLQ